MKKSIIIILFLFISPIGALFFFSSSFALPEAGKKNDLLYKKIYRYFKTNSLSGAYLISHGGKIISEGYPGYSDIETKKRLTDTSRFSIGSLTKQFTGFLIFNAIAEGRAKPHSLITEKLPELKGTPLSTITIDHLIKMTSGLPHNFNLPDMITPQLTSHIYSDSEYLEKIKNYRPAFIPGSKFQYSNLNYALLAIILERTYGTSWAGLVRTKIFHRFSMSNSRIGENANQDRKDFSRGYLSLPFWRTGVLKMPRWNYSMIRGASGITTTVRDFMAWQKALTSFQKKSSGFNRYFDSGNKKNKFYSFGWIKKTILHRGRRITAYYHAGQDPGFVSWIIRIREKKLVAVCFWNIDRIWALRQVNNFEEFIEPLLLDLQIK